MQLNIQTLSGTLLSISIDPETKIGCIKKEICVQFGIKLENQLLVYNGIELEDDRSLNEYTKHSDTSLFIELRMSVSLQKKLSRTQIFIDEYGYSDCGNNIIY